MASLFGEGRSTAHPAMKTARTPRRSSSRALAVLLLLALVALSSCRAESEAPRPAQPAEHVLRVVRPKQLTALSVLEKQGKLEARLRPLGFSVQWLEFAAGPQQLEALGADALDIASTAESPPIFAQAAGTQLAYLASVPPSGKTVSLLVPSASTARSIRELKGKKIAFQKASIGHYLLIKALAEEGLALSDVESVFLPPADANAALSRGAVDGWFIWEPFVTRAVQSGVGRVLLDGERLRDSCNFLTTTRRFVSEHPDVLEAFLAELQQAEAWSRDHPREMAELLSSSLMIDVPTLLEMHGKYTYGVLPITEGWIAKQQEVADMWQKLGFLPKQVDVRASFLSSAEYARLGPPPLPDPPR
jgi:sulfonate transport system substrate-binding protein